MMDIPCIRTNVVIPMKAGIQALNRERDMGRWSHGQRSAWIPALAGMTDAVGGR